MTKFLRTSEQKTTLLVAIGLASIMAFAGCGGGGGGDSTPTTSTSGSTTGGPPITTATITGTLVETSTLKPLVSYNVKVNGTPLVDATNSAGQFTINNVPVGSHQLIITDSVGSLDTTITITVPNSSATDNLGTIKVDTTGNPPPPPV